MLGLPFVGSDRPSYAGVAGAGGLLVGDEPAAWRTALETAFREADDRVARARRTVLAERTVGPGVDTPGERAWRAALGLA